MSTDKPTIFIVDDDLPALREVSGTLRLAEYSIEAFTSPQEYLKRSPYQGTGCIVAALHMIGMPGLELHRVVQSRGSSLPVIFLTSCDKVSCAVRALKAGAVDVLVKPDYANLLQAVEEAIAQHRTLLAKRQELTQLEERFRLLTPKEREVCLLVRRGLLNKQIAYELEASEKTIKLHRARVMRKLDVTSVPALVDFLRTMGTHETKMHLAAETCSHK